MIVHKLCERSAVRITTDGINENQPLNQKCNHFKILWLFNPLKNHVPFLCLLLKLILYIIKSSSEFYRFIFYYTLPNIYFNFAYIPVAER